MDNLEALPINGTGVPTSGVLVKPDAVGLFDGSLSSVDTLNTHQVTNGSAMTSSGLEPLPELGNATELNSTVPESSSLSSNSSNVAAVDSSAPHDSLTGVAEGAAMVGGSEVKINFQPDSAPVPDGFAKDIGDAYSETRSYGWVRQDSLGGDRTPLDITLNSRERNQQGISQQFDTLLHMQYPTENPNPAAVKIPAAWEYALPNGTYNVSVSVGDSGYFDSQHTINIEGVNAIKDFQGTPKQKYKQATVDVDVIDGRLTVDAIGGLNTKINYIEIVDTNLKPEKIVGSTVMHPDMYLDELEIAAIKAKVQAGEAPWTTTYEQVIADANKALESSSFSVTENGGPGGGHDYKSDPPYLWNSEYRDGQINPNADRNDYVEVKGLGKVVRDLGLAYSFTQDSKYAEKAVNLIETWTLNPETRMSPRFTDNQSNIELTLTLPGMFYGADLIYNYPGWSAERKDAFEVWVGAIAENAKGWSRKNNFENWRLNFIASAGSLLKDQSLLDYAFSQYKEDILHQIDEQGRMRHELARTNSLSYSLFALNAMTQTAEIADHHGVNLYDYTSNGSKGLKLALDYYAKYATDPGQWPYPQVASFSGSDSVALYELAYSRWQEPSYLEVINRWGRPLVEDTILGPVSLTHSTAA